MALFRRSRRPDAPADPATTTADWAPAVPPVPGRPVPDDLASHLLAGGRLPLSARLALGRDGTARYEDSVREALDALRRAEHPPALDPYERMAMLMPRIEAMRADGRLSDERYQEIRRFLVAEIERSEGSESR